MAKDRGAQTKTEAKRLRIEHSFLPSNTFKFVYEDYTIVLRSLDPCFSFKSLALQHCINRASDDGTMLGYRSMTVGNAAVAHKASAVR